MKLKILEHKNKMEIKDAVKLMSIDTLKEFLIDILETEKSYTISPIGSTNDLRLLKLIKDLIGFRKVECNLCKKSYNIMDTLTNGVILKSWEIKFICNNCLNEIDEERQ